MSLDKYRQKRDFTKTKEPVVGKAKGKALSFVVQRHHASHLHYDFRLEMNGVLKSWAVPKGPSLNPADKRLAMMVEDHPYDYRTFEGEIPAGNYGGGVVNIFDAGTYTALDKGTEKDLRSGLENGNLKFKLKGKILKGEFALVKLKSSEQNAWLLIKHDDKYAVRKKFNAEDLVSAAIKKSGWDFKKKSKKTALEKSVDDEPSDRPQKKARDNYAPMQAKLSASVFDDPDWVYERKLDGYRALAFTTANGAVKLISRNGIDFSANYEVVVNALMKLEMDAVIDGELIVFDKQGKTSFQLLQHYNEQMTGADLRFWVFDLLSLNGHDLRQMALVKRKELLNKIIGKLGNPLIVYSKHIVEEGKALFEEARKADWEGIIAKNSNSTYLSGKRSESWLKFKFQQTQEAVIIGYSKPAGERKYFGALALAINDGDELVYIGNCGTGYSEDSLQSIYKQMQPLIRKNKPVQEAIPKEKSFIWLKPSLVCEVSYSEWTADQHLRHPVFKGLRVDKTQEQVVIEVVDKLESLKQKKNMATEKVEQFGRKKVALTNLTKLYWPKEKISKGQLIDYYKSVAPFILPYLKDKPLSLNRHPNGITKPGFFQKDLDTDKIPSWIKYAPLHSESNDKDIDYLVCNDEATLLWMANLGCIEINPWLSTYKKPENPLFAVLDLDPHDIDFNEAIAVALTAKKILDKIGITSFIKTSGSKGLHIFIPVGQRYDYDITKEFIHYIGQLIFEKHPDTTSLERSPAKRKGKIYLDFLQNRRGQTIAAPYSVRPKPGATVSSPLKWEEVKEGLSIQNFDIFNMTKRLKEIGELWKDINQVKNNLKKALKMLV
ncbi:DNA ligase D [Pedobacter nyackensis]|uniref:DNA ligase D n=1 Tax=Pedobacter nyackensis TaxID=475255 RepID=UPI00292F983D|nr:DNA ligase D [Pedobacter nyackensis]